MVLEALVALNLASSIIQFVDYSYRLFQKGKELYQAADGALTQNVELETISKDLAEFSSRLAANASTQNNQGLSHNEESLFTLAKKCMKAAEKLQQMVQGVPVKGKNKKWKSFRQALLSVWKEPDVDAAKKELDWLRNELSIRLLAVMNDKSSIILITLMELSERHRSLEINSSNKLDQLRSEILTALEPPKEPIAGFREHQNTSDESPIVSGGPSSIVAAARKKLPKLTQRQNWELENSSLSKQSQMKQIDLNLVSSKVTDLIQDTSLIASNLKMIMSLWFPGMNSRRSNIKVAKDDTMDWIFKEFPEETSPRHDFSTWLRFRGGMFWIAGKAGSGKSTLFKHFCNHQRTKALLREWSGSHRLVTASFFFWTSGSETAKSQEGLLRSLLFEILRQDPDLIPVISSHMTLPGLAVNDLTSWTREDLFKTLDDLLRNQSSGRYFCFFIDALDEYKGHALDEHKEDLPDLLHLLKRVCCSDNVKICVSSRPWTIFDLHLGQNPSHMLRVQDFTADDISLYVRSELSRHPRYEKVERSDGSDDDLICQIVQKAKGVFLWVWLAVRSLQTGLDNADNISELLERLNSLPEDLEHYYLQMFNSIEPFYKRQTAQLLLVCLAASVPLSPIIISFLEETDPNFAVDGPISPWSQEKLVSKYEEMVPRVNARCKDLMEIVREPNRDIISQYRVDFLHRTVRDFLRQQDLRRELWSRVPADFNAHVFLCRGILALIKLLPLRSGVSPYILRELTEMLMQHARLAEMTRNCADSALLQEADRVLSVHWRENRDWLYEPDGMESYRAGSMQDLAATWGLDLFLAEQLKKQEKQPSSSAGGAISTGEKQQSSTTDKGRGARYRLLRFLGL